MDKMQNFKLILCHKQLIWFLEIFIKPNKREKLFNVREVNCSKL